MSDQNTSTDAARSPDELKRESTAIDTTVRLPDVDPIRKYFAWNHLPPKLQHVSIPFSILADDILKLPRCAERSVALRKLLESKDAAVRAALEDPNWMPPIVTAEGSPPIGSPAP